MKNDGRHILPRWRDVQTTGVLGELDSTLDAKRSFFGEEQSIVEKLEAWKSNPSLGFAADLVGAALTLRNFEAADGAAKFLLSPRSGASITLRQIAEQILGQQDFVSPQRAVTQDSHRISLKTTVQLARARLKSDPRNALAWAEMSRAYASLGIEEKARNSMKIAFSLGGSSRFILRSAARLNVHLGDKQLAHDLLKRSDAVNDDPWLMAAEIASADLLGRTSKLIRRGRDLIESRKFHPLHVSELATAIAGLEINAGRAKSAKKLFEIALVEPTENCVAQIEWSLPKISGFTIPQKQFQLPLSHEARARYSEAAADWATAINEAMLWHYDEPFSTRPAGLGSYVAANISLISNFPRKSLTRA